MTAYRIQIRMVAMITETSSPLVQSQNHEPHPWMEIPYFRKTQLRNTPGGSPRISIVRITRGENTRACKKRLGEKFSASVRYFAASFQRRTSQRTTRP